MQLLTWELSTSKDACLAWHLRDRYHRCHIRPGIRVNIVLRTEAGRKEIACSVAPSDNVQPNHLGPPLGPFSVWPHQHLTHNIIYDD